MVEGALWDHLAQAQCRRCEFESHSQSVAGLEPEDPEDAPL